MENQDWLSIFLGEPGLANYCSFSPFGEFETLDPDLHPDFLGVQAQTHNETSFLFSQNDLGHYVLGIGVELCRTTFCVRGCVDVRVCTRESQMLG